MDYGVIVCDVIVLTSQILSVRHKLRSMISVESSLFLSVRKKLNFDQPHEAGHLVQGIALQKNQGGYDDIHYITHHSSEVKELNSNVAR